MGIRIDKEIWKSAGRCDWMVCLQARLVLEALHTMCRSTLFSRFLVPLILALLLGAGLHLASVSAEDPVLRSVEVQEDGPPPDGSKPADEDWHQLEHQGIAVHELLVLLTDPDASLELRNRAVLALADMGLPDAQSAGVLYEVLADHNAPAELRHTILIAHGERQDFAAVLVPALRKVLSDPAHGPILRRQVVFHLSDHLSADGVVEQLTQIIGDAGESDGLRTAALDLLRLKAEQPLETWEVLQALAVNQDEPTGLRLAALDLLGRWRAADASGAKLVEVLFQPNAPAEVQRATVMVLTARDRQAPVALGRWLALLEASDRVVEVRRYAAWSLARSNELGAQSLELCVRLLADEEEDTSIRLAAAEHLHAHGAAAEPALKPAERILADEQQPIEVREAAGKLWVQVARDWLAAAKGSSWETIIVRMAAMDQAQGLLEPVAATSSRARQNLDELRHIRMLFAAQQEARWADRAWAWTQRHPQTSLTILLLGLLALLVLGLAIIWWRLSRRTPMRIWQLDRRLARWDWQLPTWLGELQIGPRHLLLLERQARSARVLYAWIETVRPYVHQHLDQLRNAHRTTPYVPLPVRWNGQPCTVPPWDSIQQRLTISGGGIVVGGDAGTGKTACALECARRLIEPTETARNLPLPVWIGRPHSIREGVVELAVEVRAALALLVPKELLPEVISIGMMLNDGLLVPILDAVSEWPPEVIPSVQVALERFHRHHGSFLVTTRHPDIWTAQAVTRLEFSPLRGAVAIGFLQAFLTNQYSEAQTGGGRLMAANQRWTELSDEAPMPVLIIRIFGEVAMRQSDAHLENLVDLARAYVQLLMRDAGPCPLDEAHVMRVAGRLAWAELNRAERSAGLTAGERQTALIGVEQAPETVDYLDHRIALLERWQPGDGIRFRHQPLATLLAAMHLIAVNGDNEEAWKHFLQQPDPAPGSALAMIYRTLWDVSLLPSSSTSVSSPIPEWVCQELAQRLGINPSRREARRQAVCARDLVQQILTPENPERSRALEQLAAMGPAAAPALTSLESVVRDQDQDLDVRFGALTALGLLGSVALPARATLDAAVRDRGEQLFIRLKALEFLAAMGPERPDTIAILVDRLADPVEAELLRLRAGNILAALASHREAIQSALEPLDVSSFPPAVRELVRKLSSNRTLSSHSTSS
jgi:sorbitol-specific phosphotransferase system component IIA